MANPITLPMQPTRKIEVVSNFVKGHPEAKVNSGSTQNVVSITNFRNPRLSPKANLGPLETARATIQEQGKGHSFEDFKKTAAQAIYEIKEKAA